MSITHSISFIVLLSVFCDQASQKSDREALDAQRRAILALIAQGQCSSTPACRFIALGSKPCGGPWEYVAYSPSVDTTLLLSMIGEYDKNEEAYNRRWGIMSDCAVAPPPDSVACFDGVCVKYRSGAAY